MLIGEILEKASIEASWQLTANIAADFVRNTWLRNKEAGTRCWEESYAETTEACDRLREEGFQDVYGLDVVFQWWENESDLDALAGNVLFIWKLKKGDKAEFAKTTIRLANQDFVLGTYATEQRKREVFHNDFQKAFATWKAFF